MDLRTSYAGSLSMPLVKAIEKGTGQTEGAVESCVWRIFDAPVSAYIYCSDVVFGPVSVLARRREVFWKEAR